MASSAGNGAASKGFDYDLVIIGAGVGGHGAALHAVEKVNLVLCRLIVLVQADTDAMLCLVTEYFKLLTLR